MLSNKSDTSVILINSKKEAKFMYVLEWLKNTIVCGDFTVEADRAVVAHLGETALKVRLQQLRKSGALSTYRFFIAHMASMLGHTKRPWSLRKFLASFQFASLEEAASDQSSMPGALCATLCGDVGILRLLAQCRADMNMRVNGLVELGYPDGQQLLVVAAKSGQPPPVLATLIELRADVMAKTNMGATVSNFVRSPQQLQVIMEARADLHSSHEPYGFTPLGNAAASAGSDSDTIEAMLKVRCDPNPPLHGLGFSPLQLAITHSRGEKTPLRTVRLLLEHRADPNALAVQSGRFGSVCQEAIKEVAVLGRQKSTYFNRTFSILPGLSPIGQAALVGDVRITQLLLDFKADASVPCDIGLFPEDIAEENGHDHLLPLLLVSL